MTGDKSDNDDGVDRRITREDRKAYLLYPEDVSKTIWDQIVTLTLVIMCITAPVYISFPLDNNDGTMSSW